MASVDAEVDGETSTMGSLGSVAGRLAVAFSGVVAIGCLALVFAAEADARVPLWR